MRALAVRVSNHRIEDISALWLVQPLLQRTVSRFNLGFHFSGKTYDEVKGWFRHFVVMIMVRSIEGWNGSAAQESMMSMRVLQSIYKS